MIEIGHLDLNIVEHCNMTCVNCSHSAPAAKVWSMDLQTIERDLQALKPFLHVHNLNLVGGEPTLHKEIVDIMRLTKRIRLGVATVVITNATLLPRMAEEFWQELEYLSISAYPALKPECLELAREKQKQYAFGLGERVFTEFHRQFRQEPNDGSHFSTCHWKSDCFTVHEGFFYLCPQSAFFPQRFMSLPIGSDGLDLEGITESKLRAFMDRTEPLAACRICMANEMKPLPWKEAPRKEWLEQSRAG